ncbi:aldo/keto reductase [Egibacter rhizosphaerae]|uniref:Aldo/keto reductase n=2 Tax=Egibacter rhizosphaerae TaxID=1670831 RepID=A0A411YLM8_9ACTN|nr:aldo/keto reductase [Egibacter rhizosphaerae]
MRLTGKGIWGEPGDPEQARQVLRRAVELGVTLIDTADSYGPEVSERLIAEALHPYPEELVIATKAGLCRTGPDQWVPNGRPAYLVQQCELSLRRLGVDTIDLFQLHRIDRDVPMAEQLGALHQLREAGKIRHIGLSEVDAEQLAAAREHVDVASVQNRYNLADREHEPVLEVCEAAGIGFIPWFPVATGDLAQPGGALDEVARRHDATPAQVALSWLLHHSPVVLPIPGTSQVAHLEENCAAATIELSEREVAELAVAGEQVRPGYLQRG